MHLLTEPHRCGIESLRMRLHTTITSPYSRKVWVAAHEVGLAGRIERIATNPHHDEYLRDDNPLCRVPTLLLADGEALFDSPVICEYLDSLHDGPKLIPPTGPARWQTLRLQAIGDGILDANVSRRNETIRPVEEQSSDWIERQCKAVAAACLWLERRIDLLNSTPVTIGHIAVACALGYFAVRFPSDTWDRDCPRLADWHLRFEERPAMRVTRYENLKRELPPELAKEGPASSE
jgi:glutathione S-transferase